MLALLIAAGTAFAHDFDHPVPSGSQAAPLSSGVNAGGTNASWELVATLPTGNPQTDLDFFTRGGETYASVGSLAIGPNSAGQNIIKLTDKGLVKPSYVTGHPSATCPKATSSATGLQHDPEASPKGNALPQVPNPHIVTTDTQVVIDATDATGRCHDNGVFGIALAPQGGLEIIDVTDPAKPKEIGLTSHVGQAHTVNVDPKRPHIAFVSSSDAVNYDDKGVRANDNHPKPPPEGTAAPGAVNNGFDGIEVVNFASCMDFPAGASLQLKRDTCKPEVFRFRWPNVDFARSNTFRATGACHELEIYPDDKVACAGLMASLLLDFKGAFDDRGTPADFTDDTLRGTPLPCARRDSSSPAEPLKTKAKITDCVVGVVGGNAQSLRVPDWLKMTPPPSLEGVTKLGGAHHMGFENQQVQNVNPPFDATKDIFVSHEAELTQSGRYLLVSDERGGGVLPVGSTCTQGADNPFGNGGIHAFPLDKLGTAVPAPGGDKKLVEAYQAAIYAKDSKGNRAIYRAPVHTKPQSNVCTSHVFQQIPGQNRIFMAWYSQGTQVVDFTENLDGTIDFKTAGYFIPESANEWTSHVFKVQENKDGTFTYWGAAADFALGDGGRNAIDIYKVTLPPPPKPRFDAASTPQPGEQPGEQPATPPGNAGPPNSEGVAPGTPTFPVSETRGQERGTEPPACARASGFETVSAEPRGKRVRFSFARTSTAPVRVQVFRHSKGRKVITKRVANFKNRKKAFTWNGKKAGDGYYQARFTTRAPNMRRDTRQVGLRRVRGRFRVAGAFDRRASCELVQYFGLSRPVFGGKKRGKLGITVRLKKSASVSFEVSRGGKVVRRVKAKSYPAAKRRTIAVRLGKKAKRGLYTVRLKADRPGEASELVLFSRYL